MKKRRIGVLLDDRALNNIDLSNVEEGNVGIGGTEYCFAMLIYYASKKLSDYRIVVLHYNNTIRLPEGVESVIIEVEHWEEMALLELDMLIFRAGFHRDDGLLPFAEKNGISLIAWAHNYLYADAAKELAMCCSVKRVVFVGRQIYEHYIDHEIISKSTYIYNMISMQEVKEDRIDNYEPSVVFTGSIIPIKGFHLLAREWKKIVREVPKAQLYVIGNGKLYNDKCILGKYGIAEEAYERRFMHYFLDDEKKISDSVHFLGKLGIEKYDIYKYAAVGVMNPGGRSETFGLSAVEMEQMGLPVVVYNKASYPDIINNSVTGYLCNSRKQFRKKIIYLLTNQSINQQMGKSGRALVKNKFSPNVVIGEWQVLFNEVLCNKGAISKMPQELFTHDCKWLRILNKKIRKRFRRWPSLIVFDEINNRWNAFKESFARHMAKMYPY